MKIITVNQPKSDRMVDQLASLYYALIQIDKNEAANFDLSQLNFVGSLFLASLASYIKDTDSDYASPKNVDLHSYLRTIAFPNCLKTISSIQKRKNYLPLSTIEKSKNIKDKEEILNCFYNLIYKLTGEVPKTKDSLIYPISELVNNIFEHSGKNQGILSGQIFPTKNYLEISIVDRGIGIASSYKKAFNKEYNDERALKLSMSGESSKSDVERGYGIHTSKKLVCNGLGGEFLLLSGNAALLSTLKEDKIFTLPKFYWQGVIVSYRIPFPKSPIEIYKYVE